MRRRHRHRRLAGLAALAALASSAALGTGAGCDSTPSVPQQPTWADVAPILRGQCTGCHGGSASETGSIGGVVYRFDFYDMTDAVCGDAAQALAGQSLAHAYAPLIGADVTPPPTGGRARMPPAPADPLLDWQRETLVKWAHNPVFGAPPLDEHRPEIQLSASSAVVDGALPFTAVIDDPDGESVVGVLRVGPMTFAMDRPGAFGATIDTSAWPDGPQHISAVLCDGWGSVDYDNLGNVQIAH